MMRDANKNETLTIIAERVTDGDIKASDLLELVYQQLDQAHTYCQDDGDRVQAIIFRGIMNDVLSLQKNIRREGF